MMLELTLLLNEQYFKSLPQESDKIAGISIFPIHIVRWYSFSGMASCSWNEMSGDSKHSSLCQCYTD